MTKPTFLQEDNARKPIIQIPEVNAAHAALIVQLPIHIEGLVGRNLELPHPLAGNRAILQWRIKLIAPGRAVAVPVPVVIAEQVIAVGLRAAADL